MQIAIVVPLVAMGLLTGRPDVAAQGTAASWRGVVRDAAGKPLSGAVVELRLPAATEPKGSAGCAWQSTTNETGAFGFEQLVPGTYSVSLNWQGKTVLLQSTVSLRKDQHLEAWLEFSAGQQRLALHVAARTGEATETVITAKAKQGSSETQLSSQQVSNLPLNKRDFTQLLQQSVGTTTDTNGASNFTQQFAVNGQRGTTAVFATDGVDTTDPELGGATFANFNVDAIQEIRTESGVMPATIGEGAAGFTNIITKSGTASVHGSVFEFVRNAAFDARNFFDQRTVANPGRIPPFARNEFGFTNGGPVVLPKLYDGRGRTFYFVQYQGFRQVLSVTEVLSVPTAAEREGVDTTTYPGDTLTVPVNPAIASVLARYPLPDDPQGSYGARTFATASKVSTDSNQFSVRIDHTVSSKAQLFGRFNFNNNDGPTTNPSQIAIDPSFALSFLDHQRAAALRYTRTVTPYFVSDTSLGYIRSTPLFTSNNQVQPGLTFGDGLYEPFNSVSGANYGSWGNLWQFRQNFTWVRGRHTLNVGFEARLNRDTTIFALGPDGTYTFGGGTAYSPVTILSASGLHNIYPGDPLPDSLTGFLTGTPYSFTASIAGPEFPQGNRTGLAGVEREAYNAYFQDNWKISPHLLLSYGLRYEVNARIHEKHHLTSGPLILGPGGQQVVSWASGAYQDLLVYPQPPYRMDWRGWGPRASLNWSVTPKTTVRCGAAITTLLPNLFVDNGLTGGIPYVLNPTFQARPGAPVPFTGGVLTFNAPPVYTPQGTPIFTSGNTTQVPANTPVDLQRLEDDLAALSSGQPVQALLVYGMTSNFQNGYIETYTAGVSHQFGDINFNLSYVGTAGVKLPGLVYPNNYAGAETAFAPFTRFDSAGHVLGGIGPEFLMGNPSHSTFNSGEASVSKTSTRWGLGFQASYTYSKSIDNASTAAVGIGPTPSGTVLQSPPQDPRNPGAEKGPSTFDIPQILAFNFVQVLPLDGVSFLRPLPRRVTSGWQLMGISILTSGSPFSILSGVQQTGLGSDGADRPDQAGQPVLSTSRTVREDYFGLGANNPSFFSIPLNVPGGTGPNQGRLGTLGRNTFRGPGYRNFDFALMKDIPLASRGNSEPVVLQFRAEFFNAFNLVNFGLPSNIVRGTGFGVISRTAGTSRQLQFSLKLVF
jgi:Carboxypeptidase regulatory-like domain/TonB-dependent Receptor Plug Domain